MLIVGAYAEQFTPDPENSPFQQLFDFLEKWLPSGTGLHLLPIWDSNGDGGFAVNSWTKIDPKYGSLDELEGIARTWSVYIDGIFNHVAWDHPIAKRFLDNPDECRHLVHSHKGSKAPRSPLAPRGGSMYRRAEKLEDDWYVWQTFGSQAIDINLSNSEVMNAVKSCIKFYRQVGFRGIRLDALAYYGKSSEVQPVHNKDGIEIALKIIDFCKSQGFEAMLQIDCDSNLDLYKSVERLEPIVIDYSFSAKFIFAIIMEDPTELAAHIEGTRESSGFKILRPVRTHDGVLFRSENLTEETRQTYERIIDRQGFQKRITNNNLYENNNSLPYLLGAAESIEQYYWKVCAGILIAELTSTHSYILLHSLLCDIPEHDLVFSDDPRELQRRRVTLEGVIEERWKNGGKFRELSLLLKNPIFIDMDKRCFTTDVLHNLLILTVSSSDIVATINFSGKALDYECEGDILFQCGYSNGTLKGFGVILCQSKLKRKT